MLILPKEQDKMKHRISTYCLLSVCGIVYTDACDTVCWNPFTAILDLA